MDDEKIELIAAYEISHNIPDVNRYTEYVEEYNCNMNKLGIAPEFIDRRYNEALNEKKAKEALDPACVLVLEVTMSHNLKDVAKFTLDNVNNMLDQFYSSNYKERKIGYKEKDKDPVYLLSYRENYEYPEILSPNDIEHINLRQEWFIKVIELKNKRLIEDTKNIIARADSSLSSNGEKCYIGLDKILECVAIAEKIGEIPKIGISFWQNVLEKFNVNFFEININENISENISVQRLS